MVEYESRKAMELAGLTSAWLYVRCLNREKGRHRVRCASCGYERAVYSFNHIPRCLNCERLQKKLQREQSKRKVCAVCGKAFESMRCTAMYCSNKCKERGKANRHPDVTRERHRITKRLREARATKNGRVDYSITLSGLIKRDGGVCKLCGQSVDESDYFFVGDTFVAGNNYPSIDHITPLSKGGLHQWDNVQLAHRLCNSIKCDK